MAENTAKVYNMSMPTDMDDDSGPPADAAGGGGGKPAQRPKRKKKLDTGKLQTLFRDWCLQFSSQVVWHLETRQPYSVAGLRNQYGNDEVRMWMSSAKRRDVHANQIVFDPAGTCGPECINLFGGLETIPVPGNYLPIVELLYHLVDLDEEVRDWVLDWIAYPLQNPGAKMPTSVIMHGDEGSGKNLFWEIVRDIYGEYASIVGQAQLEDKFNDWLSRKLFIIGDEVLSRQEMRHLKGQLKAMISGREIQINTKMMPVRTEANHVNLVFLSNELQPNALDASDRRYCVIWTPPKKARKFYQDVAACRDNGGREAFMHHLLQRDLSQFDPYAAPPTTKAKGELIELGRPSPERWFLAWQAGNLAVPYNSCSADQAYRFYKRWCIAEGERSTYSKNFFLRMVGREAKETFTVRVCRLGSSSTSVRLWMVAPPPDGLSDNGIGAWAKECIDAFEPKLSAFTGADQA